MKAYIARKNFEENNADYEKDEEETLCAEVFKRRDLIINSIMNHFKSLDDIVFFMTGHHYAEHYYKYGEKNKKFIKSILIR
jgi:hypothetical protein